MVKKKKERDDVFIGWEKGRACLVRTLFWIFQDRDDLLVFFLVEGVKCNSADFAFNVLATSGLMKYLRSQSLNYIIFPLCY